MGVDAQMLVKSKKQLSERERLDIAINLYNIFPDIVWVRDKHCFYQIEEYYQDGDPIIPSVGETFYEVSLSCRYYGIGYERGPILSIIELTQYLKHALPDCQVFYGGDSSGVCAEEFTEEEQNKLRTHLFTVAHKPYRQGFSSIFDKSPEGPVCERCKIPMYSNGGGGDKTFYHCHGCPNQKMTKGNKIVYESLDGGEDFFEVIKRY